ncbi:MAG: YcxB family protein [Anaeroplasmataceae bacterium]|nr:YcxB family protein [Anaeroplasmataceae bacterium]
MVIKNTTHITGEEAIEIIVNYSKSYYYKKYIFSVIMAVLGSIIIGIVAAQGNSIDTMVIGILFLSFAVILALINTYSIFTLKKRTHKKNPNLVEHGMENAFTFKEESFLLQVKIGDKVSKVEYPYNALSRIIEYEDQIYFVLGDNDFYVCKKDSFKSPKELEVFFYGLAKHKTKIKKKLTKEKKSTQN